MLILTYLTNSHYYHSFSNLPIITDVLNTLWVICEEIRMFLLSCIYLLAVIRFSWFLIRLSFLKLHVTSITAVYFRTWFVVASLMPVLISLLILKAPRNAKAGLITDQGSYWQMIVNHLNDLLKILQENCVSVICVLALHLVTWCSDFWAIYWNYRYPQFLLGRSLHRYSHLLTLIF